MLIKYKKLGLCKVVDTVSIHGQAMYKLKPIQPIWIESKWTIGLNYCSAPRDVEGYLYDVNKLMKTYVYISVDDKRYKPIEKENQRSVIRPK